MMRSRQHFGSIVDSQDKDRIANAAAAAGENVAENTTNAVVVASSEHFGL